VRYKDYEARGAILIVWQPAGMLSPVPANPAGLQEYQHQRADQDPQSSEQTTATTGSAALPVE
jgi:hypothetical protein